MDPSTYPQDTTRPLGHRGPCGPRRQCFLDECRERFGAYQTLEVLSDRAICYGHRMSIPLDDPRLRAVAA
jgi:hypothetical protein